MVVVIGPCFSLSASGCLGKPLLYYDTKYGARVKFPKRTFQSPGNVWEINKEWFKKASDRWKSLSVFARRAWNQWSTSTCDCGRDLFMGRQIELWNLSELNDTTWPEVSLPKLPQLPSFGWWTPSDSEDFTFRHLRWWPVKIYEFGFQDILMHLWHEYIKHFTKSIVGVRWFQKLDSEDPPDESNLKVENHAMSHTFTCESGHWNYFWYEFIRWDGSYSDLTYAYKEWWD